MAQAAAQQTAGVEEITKAMTEIDAVTQSGAASAEEGAAAAEELTAQAASLAEACAELEALGGGLGKKPAEGAVISQPMQRYVHSAQPAH